jgi:hypothetical protein
MLALNCSIVVEGKSLYFSVYSSKLVAVELKAKSGILPVEFNGEFAIQGNDTLYLYKDERVDLSWKIGLNRFSLILTNKTEESIKIDWNYVTFIDCFNQVERVLPTGTKYLSYDSQLPPAIIPRGAILNSDILPACNVKMSKAGKWVEVPMIPLYYRSEEAMKEIAPSFIGKKMNIVMPLNIGQEVYEYTFTFIIDKIIVEGSKKVGNGEMKRIEQIMGEKIVK